MSQGQGIFVTCFLSIHRIEIRDRIEMFLGTVHMSILLSFHIAIFCVEIFLLGLYVKWHSGPVTVTYPDPKGEIIRIRDPRSRSGESGQFCLNPLMKKVSTLTSLNCYIRSGRLDKNAVYSINKEIKYSTSNFSEFT